MMIITQPVKNVFVPALRNIFGHLQFLSAGGVLLQTKNWNLRNFPNNELDKIKKKAQSKFMPSSQI